MSLPILLRNGKLLMAFVHTSVCLAAPALVVMGSRRWDSTALQPLNYLNAGLKFKGSTTNVCWTPAIFAAI